jgi:heme exporter protein C
MNFKANWWKFGTALLLVYTFIAGFLMPVPRLNILNETIRNLYFHVPMWFGQIIVFTVSIVYSFKYLLSYNRPNTSSDQLTRIDIAAHSGVTIGMLYGTLGLLTGMIWGNFTWGTPWSSDPKLNCTAIGMLIYLAYFVLRSSFTDFDKRARFAAIYNLFCYVMFIVLIFIIPRMREFSIHPGNGGNPGFSSYDLDSRMRMVFYPAVIAWSGLAIWIWTILKKYRISKWLIHLRELAGAR